MSRCWRTRIPDKSLLGNLTPDVWLLFVTRFTRLLAYGALSVVLVIYLTGLGLSEPQTGLLFTLTLAGDIVISLFLTTAADRVGRRRMLVVGSLLMAGAGVAFACTSNFLFLVLAGTIGVVRPSGNEVGPFLPIEQAALAHVIPSRFRTAVFAWYTLAGSFATAIGSLCGGLIPGVLQGKMAPDRYRAVVVLYACLGLLLALVFVRLSPAVEVNTLRGDDPVPPLTTNRFGVTHSRRVVSSSPACSLLTLSAAASSFRASLPIGSIFVST